MKILGNLVHVGYHAASTVKSVSDVSEIHTAFILKGQWGSRTHLLLKVMTVRTFERSGCDWPLTQRGIAEEEEEEEKSGFWLNNFGKPDNSETKLTRSTGFILCWRFLGFSAVNGTVIDDDVSRPLVSLETSSSIAAPFTAEKPRNLQHYVDRGESLKSGFILYGFRFEPQTSWMQNTNRNSVTEKYAEERGDILRLKRHFQNFQSLCPLVSEWNFTYPLVSMELNVT